MLDHVLAANIDNEGNTRMYSRHVGEILFRPNSQIRATRRHALHQGWNDEGIAKLIRNEILRDETAAFFRRTRDKPPELCIRKPRGKRERAECRSEHEENEKDR